MENNETAKLDYEIEQLKESNNLSECLILIEKNLLIKSEKYGKFSREFTKTAKELCEVCNLIALNLMENSNPEEGLKYLIKSEKLFQNYKDILTLCYNNIGCYYILYNKFN